MPISEYTETWYEYMTIMTQLEGFTDEDLVEEIMYASYYDLVGIDPILTKFLKQGIINAEERAQLEAAYVLVHCEEEYLLK